MVIYDRKELDAALKGFLVAVERLREAKGASRLNLTDFAPDGQDGVPKLDTAIAERWADVAIRTAMEENSDSELEGPGTQEDTDVSSGSDAGEGETR